MSSSGGSATAGGGGTANDGGVASLEDCYTNIFHITELTGLKWCCLANSSDQPPHQSRPVSAADSATGAASSAAGAPQSDANAADGSVDDPVLRAYAQCVADGVLCAWRRRQPPSAAAAYESPVPKANAAKELWLFWYSVDEPKHIEQFKAEGLTVLVHSEIVDMDSPRVEFEYETRTLFFKALNTAIERRLLAEGFVRFGHWLCRPLEPRGGALSRDDRRALPRFVNAVRFHFFLHRDSLVCASLCVQRQPTILRLAKAQLRERSRAQPVILAPWSIRAKLVPGQHDLLRLVASSRPTSTGDELSGGPSTSSQPEEVPSSSSLSVFVDGTQQSSPLKKDNTADSVPSSSPSVKETAASKNGENGSRMANISAIFDRQWTEWKRLYHSLADPTPFGQAQTTDSVPHSAAPSPQTNTQATTARSTATTTNASGPTGRSSGGGDGAWDGAGQHQKQQQQQQQQALPRLVMVEVNGHRMLYPSQFVAVLADELLPIVRRKRAPTEQTTKEEEEQADGDTEAAAGMSNSASTSTDSCGQTVPKSGHNNALPSSVPQRPLFLHRMRRRSAAAIGQCAARCSFEDALLRARGSGVATAVKREPQQQQQQQFQNVQQQQQHITGTTTVRTLDEFNYDYARREFCYCRICHAPSSTATTPLATTTAVGLNSPSSTASTTVAAVGGPLTPTAATTAIAAPATAATVLHSPRSCAAPPATPFHHRHGNDGNYDPYSSPATPFSASNQQHIQAVHDGIQHAHKTPFTSQKKAVPSLATGKSASSKFNGTTKSGTDDASHNAHQQHSSSQQHQQNKWARGCATNAATSSSSTTSATEWPTVPEWDLLKTGSMLANRRKTQQQLLALSRTKEGGQQHEIAATTGGATSSRDAPRQPTAVPIDPSASALAELLMDEDDGMATDGADGCDPMAHHPIQDHHLMLLGHQHPGLVCPPGLVPLPSDSTAIGLLTAQQRQRAATFGIVQQQLHHHQQQLQMQQQLMIRAEESRKRRRRRTPRGRRRDGTLTEERERQSERRRKRKPPSLHQLDTVSLAFCNEDSELFTVNPFGSLPPMPNIDEERKHMAEQKQQQFVGTRQLQQQQSHPGHMPQQQHQVVVQHQSILERLLLSPAGGGGILHAAPTEPGDRGDTEMAQMSATVQFDHHAQPATSAATPAASSSLLSSSFPQQYLQQPQPPADVHPQPPHHLLPPHSAASAMLPSTTDAESMPNAETPPALLDTSAAGGGVSTEQQIVAAAEKLANQLQQRRRRRRQNNERGREEGANEADEEEEEEEMMMEEEGEEEEDNQRDNNQQATNPNNNGREADEDERMMSMSSIDTSPASAPSPATGPSSVGGPSGAVSGGDRSLAAHRMVPVAAALLMRGGGAVVVPSGDDQSSQIVQLNPHHILSPPASNERIDSSVGSVNSQQQQQYGGSAGGQLGASAAIFGSQIPHDTLSRIYPTPPTPMQQFSPQNMMLMPSSHYQQQQQQHFQAVQCGYDDEPQVPKTTANLVDTMAQLASQLRLMTDETPLYDGVKARPIAMFGLFAGDLLNERVSPEERIRQCCGIAVADVAEQQNGEMAESKSKLMRELHDHLNHRRKRLAELCHQSPSSASLAPAAIPLLPMPPAYTKRAKLAIAARLAADKADGDAGLDARLQELERLRFRVPIVDEMVQQQMGATAANGQFAPMPHQQWAPWNGGGGGPQFAHLPSAIPPAMLIHHQQQQQQQRGIMPPLGFPSAQMFGGPPGAGGGGLRMPPGIAMAMGQANINNHRLPLSALVNPMRSPPSFAPTPSSSNSSASTPSATSAIYQQQMLFRQQQLMAAAAAAGVPSSLSRTPSVTALHQQQQPLLQRRPSALITTGGLSGTAPTLASAVTATTTPTVTAGPSLNMKVELTTTIATAHSQSNNSNNNTFAALLWDSLLEGGTVGARSSARLTLLIQDTVADLHYDIVFDACPLCCCNSNIRSAELGIYIGAPRALLMRCDHLQRRQRQQMMMGAGGGAAALLPKQWSGFRIMPTAELQKCNCGFSAVRHRYLCGRGSGLFADDIAEAGGFIWQSHQQQHQNNLSRRAFRPLFGRFNPANPTDRQFVDLLMHLSISQDMAAMVRSSRRLALGAIAEASVAKKKATSSANNYVQSPVDIYELNGVMVGILGLITATNAGGKGATTQKQSAGGASLLHPWGYQTADGVGEPRDVECLALFEELKESFLRTAPPHAVASLTASAAAAPMIPSYSNGRRLEQLTLRSFARKGGGGSKEMGGGTSAVAAVATATEANNGRTEPIPHVMVLSHAEREPILVSAQVLRDWDRLELMPADQCKDVLYLTVVPDVNVIASKCKVYMEELSNMYERRCRLGIHVPIGIREAPRDGIFRVGREENNSLSSGSTPAATVAIPTFPHTVHAMFMQFGPEFGDDMQPSLQRLRIFVECCYAKLCRFFLHNDHLFERRAFHESAYRQQQQPPQGTSLATVPDAVAMPPPAAPSGGSALGTIGGCSSAGPQSGPASATSTMLHHHHTGGPGSSSSSGSVLHSSPMAQHQHQTSPATANNGPNSVPILHGADGSSVNAGTSTVSPASSTSMAAALQRQTAEEMAQFEEKMAADLNVITGELENTAYLPHVVVCYMVNPFGTFGSDAAHRHFSVFASAVLLRMWNEFLQTMPPKRRPQLQLELLSLRSVYDFVAFVGGGSDCVGDFVAAARDGGAMDGDDDEADLCASYTRRERCSAQDELKRMAFSVYAQARILRPQIALDAMSKSMTRFGTMERMKDIMQMLGDNPLFFKFNCSPYLLAPARSFPVSLLNSVPPFSSGTTSTTASSKLPLLLCPEGERVLFLAYCILPGDDWLCAAVTDERGTLLDTTLINLWCPQLAQSTAGMGKEWRHRQRHSQIADALQRLWMFAQSVMLTQEVRNWRLVIGRMGKLGHGEFKQWTEILSKKNLKSRNNALKGKAPPEESGAVSAPCQSCAQSHGWAETPALLSACLVSTEPEPHLRVMASTSPGALGDSAGGIGTTNAAGGGSGASGGMKPSGGASSGGGGANTISSASSATSSKPAMGSAGAGRQSALGANVGAQQQWWSQTAVACPDDRSVTHIMVFQTILNVSLGHHQGEDMLQSAFDDDGDLTNVLGGFNFVEQNQEELDLDNLEIDKDEETQINNQPMAIGYTVSTAPLPPGMPSSFWHRCPAARRRAGASGIAHLKSSLHINTSNLNEEYGGGAAQQRERDSGGAAGSGGTTASSAGGGAANAKATGAEQQQLPHAQHPLDAVATDDVLRYVLESYNALSWLSLDPVTGARRSCLPVHMQAIQRLNLAVNTFWGNDEQNQQQHQQQHQQQPK
ncbi:hypothetical protein niasHS_011257 [Heterodera schachtii]|uniref:Mediator of RNA polymerase II transcription subunit 13 n=1 Tax=Heterodera schachtii TaxID=97005 RepID=A0ABD2J0L2_HETSC